jgi:hypothetical protein
MVDGKVGWKYWMALYFLQINKYFPYFFIIRSFGDEFRSIFGDILSYLSSNIGNEGNEGLLTLLAILIIVQITLAMMSACDFVISHQVHVLILCILIIPPMLFINYKLFLYIKVAQYTF